MLAKYFIYAPALILALPLCFNSRSTENESLNKTKIQTQLYGKTKTLNDKKTLLKVLSNDNQILSIWTKSSSFKQLKFINADIKKFKKSRRVSKKNMEMKEHA